MSTALYSLDSPACYRNWSMEPANFYETNKGGGGGGGGPGGLGASCKPGRGPLSGCEEHGGGGGGGGGAGGGGGGGGGGANLAELSAAAPAMYDDESAIDFSSYIDSMSSVPNLELCHDELFADLFNSNHKPERGGGAGGHAGAGDYEYLPGHPAPPHPAAHKDFASAMASLLGAGSGASPPAALKQEPDWSDSDMSSSLLPSQIATCAQTIMNLSAAGQPTPPTSPEPSGCSSSSSCSSGRSPAAPAPPPPPHLGKEKGAAGGGGGGGKKSLDRFSPEYRQRRERNNIAVRKSRDKAKKRNQEMQQKLVELSSENEKLHKKIEQLTRDLSSLRQFFKQLPSSSFLPAGTASAGIDCR
ncbi:CCAAT/enhancer-binding protein delta [Sarcophilus harrisii]|uniref:CCAAT/enhancer-binding protein delta n=1 Tax=Sarcophilus harrisii TaxID=9305 RepID=A0A7N4Q1Z5_SARHA|nr:CCAAT/enhancer-binding protein delta [Sarcophilus harrisii]